MLPCGADTEDLIDKTRVEADHQSRRLLMGLAIGAARDLLHCWRCPTWSAEEMAISVRLYQSSAG